MAEWDIFQFIRQEVATTLEWADYMRVKDAKPPKSRNHLEDMKFRLYPEKALPIAAEDYKTKFHLENKFRKQLKEIMTGEEWIAEGRDGGSIEYSEISRDCWNSAIISIEENRVQSDRADFVDVRIFKLQMSKREELTDFIEKCTSVLTPAKNTKAEIRALAKILLSRTMSPSTFDRAWGKADVSEKWKEPGRKEGTEKNPNSMP